MSESHPTLAPVALDAAVADIRDMRIRGAASIGRTAARALAGVANDTTDAEAREHLLHAGRTLVGARPTAVSLRNAVNLTLDGLRDPPSRLRDAVTARAVGYVRESHEAAQTIAALLADRLGPGATILTHCHSSLAVAGIVAAQARHGDIRVFADETRPWWQGQITAESLAESGVDVTLIVDSAAHTIMEEEHVDAVVVGADTVVADGRLYNKVGTRAVAAGAHAAGIPLYVAAESVKFSPYSLHGELPAIEERPTEEVIEPDRLRGVKVRNPVFDRTPAALVTEYVTERGPVEPPGVAAFIRRRFPDQEGWI